MVQLYVSEGIAENARFLEGHFPGHPIVPGAVLLGFAARALRKVGYEIDSIVRMKFLHPLSPLQPFEITLVQGDTLSSLIWNAGGVVIAQARVRLAVGA